MLRPLAVGLALVLAVAGCGGATAGARSDEGGGATACRRQADATLAGVARRIYGQAAGGRNVVSVRRRFARSLLLARAVAAGDARATRRALKPLLKNQVRRLLVVHDNRVLARVGTTRALAPVTGTIAAPGGRGAVAGTYRLAVASDAAIAGEIGDVTGARVAMLTGTRSTAAAVRATAFPRGPLTIALAFAPPPPAQCGATARQTRALTLTAVAQRLYRAEASGRATARVARVVAHDRALIAAVQADDPAALRAEIVHLFRDRTLHVVRIRATTASGRLVNDVGGPYVLAPATRRLRGGGRVTLSVQDDTGYIKLVHRFTGVRVMLNAPGGIVVPGSAALDPLPDGGRGDWRQSYTVTAFPDGPLRVTLAPPAARGASA
jgi:hypothetical protein